MLASMLANLTSGQRSFASVAVKGQHDCISISATFGRLGLGEPLTVQSALEVCIYSTLPDIIWPGSSS